MSRIKKRVLRCLACGRRIKENHPYVGVENLDNGTELHYQALPSCQMTGGQQVASKIEKGGVYVAHHYHVCDDEAPGLDCSGECFSGAPVHGRN